MYRSPSLRKPTPNDVLVKGVILAMIGLILLIAPHFMSASPLSDMFRQASVVGWFALVLGLAFIGKDGLHRLRQQRKANADKK